jgi:hypothetical protein
MNDPFPPLRKFSIRRRRSLIRWSWCSIRRQDSPIRRWLTASFDSELVEAGADTGGQQRSSTTQRTSSSPKPTGSSSSRPHPPKVRALVSAGMEQMVLLGPAGDAQRGRGGAQELKTEHGIWGRSHRRRWFLPNGENATSMCLVPCVDVVPSIEIVSPFSLLSPFNSYATSVKYLWHTLINTHRNYINHIIGTALRACTTV